MILQIFMRENQEEWVGNKKMKKKTRKKNPKEKPKLFSVSIFRRP